MLTLGSRDSTSQGQKKVWPTLVLHPPQGAGSHPQSSQFHKLDLGTLILPLAGHSPCMAGMG